MNITLKGAAKVNPAGHSDHVERRATGRNSLANPTKVVPSEGTFAAATAFEYSFPAYSATVLRIGVSK